MKASKFFVLLAGLLGIAAFFLPMIKALKETDQGAERDATPFNVVKGLHQDSQAEGADTEASKKSEMGKNVLIAAYAPAALLLLLGLIGAASGKFGRGAGFLSLLAGITSGGLGALFLQEFQKRSEVGIGLGLYGILAAGALGTLFGLIALIAPDRGN